MRFHNITKDDMLNGDGLRVVLWVAGCPHACKECHNPVTWDIDGGIPFDDDAREELFAYLSRPYISGLTLSGGDPLHPQNRADIADLIDEVCTRFPNKTIWLYTGYTWDEISYLSLLEKVDVLVDGRFEVEKKDNLLHWRGSSNQRIILSAESLKAGTLIQKEE